MLAGVALLFTSFAMANMGVRQSTVPLMAGGAVLFVAGLVLGLRAG